MSTIGSVGGCSKIMSAKNWGSRLETARVGFTCGPRVSKTGAAGAFTNMINMTNMRNQMLPLLMTMGIPQTKVTKSLRMKQKLNERLYKMQKIWK